MDNNYVNIMEQGVGNKTVLLQFIDWNNSIADVGASTGALTFEMASVGKLAEGEKIYALEPEQSTLEALTENISTFEGVVAVKDTLEEFMPKYKDQPLNIVMSGVVHHMIKHREQARDLFVECFKDVAPGTRVLIRDGVRPNRAHERTGFRCTPSSLVLAKEFFKRFAVWKGEELEYEIKGCTIWAERWLIVEMMMTITWGWGSIERECQEHYTILGLHDYLDIFQELGFEVMYAESLIQQGYQEFLPKLGVLLNDKGYQIPLPFTNQVLAFEKR